MVGRMVVAATVGTALLASRAYADDASTIADAPSATRAHAYTLAQCLALADRNFPSLWAARARLAFAHGQLDEAKWTPFFQWSANAAFGGLPPLQGSVLDPEATVYTKNITTLANLQPAFHFDIGGTFPIYTFGKITSAWEAAEAGVRVSEWDMTKSRQQMDQDVRRAFYSLQLARAGAGAFRDSIERIDHAIRGIEDKLAKANPSLNDVDRLRLVAYRQELVSQSQQMPKAEAYALAGLRFYTGQESFDVADEPLAHPTGPLPSILQYLEAARLMRGDVNQARAGVVARRALVDFNRARLFPDVGVLLGAGFTGSPGVTPQYNLYAQDPFNGFGYTVAGGAHWNLDLLPQSARIHQAEAQLEETRSLLRLALGNAGYEVEKAYADVVESSEREASWAKAEAASKQWLDLVMAKVGRSEWDERGILEPLRAYTNARGQHLYSLQDLQIARGSLTQASGWDGISPLAP